MGARWYDAQLGRWISADTIVPDPVNPQSLNRYSYVNNNPIKYIDPTGHFLQCDSKGNCYDDGYSATDPDFTSYDADERRQKLLEYNNRLYKWVQAGYTYNGEAITDLEALAQLCEYAASMIPTDIEWDRTAAFIDDVSAVLIEWSIWSGRKYYADNNGMNLGQSGFDPAFQDPGVGGEQPHHFWMWVYVTKEGGAILAGAGNLSHETWFAGDLKHLVSPFGGRSYQDFALGQEGVTMALALKYEDLAIEDVDNYVRAHLGTGTPTASRWTGASPQAKVNANFYNVTAVAAHLTLWPYR
jgi:hypothetical protein